MPRVRCTRHSAAVTIGFVVVALFVGACSDKPTPAPTAPTPPPAAVPDVAGRIGAWVEDTAFRPLAGVGVETVDGPSVGASATSDGSGRFSMSFSVPQGRAVTLRATKEGYVTVSRTVDARSLSSPYGATVVMNLAPITPPVAIETGAYSLSVESPCGIVPQELRTQTLSATIAPAASDSGAPGTKYLASVTGGDISQFYSTFWIGVAGNQVAIAEEGWLYWQRPPFRYFEGAPGPGEVSVIASTVLSGPFFSTYCELKSPMGQKYNCFTSPAEQRVTYGTCEGRITMTRQWWRCGRGAHGLRSIRLALPPACAKMCGSTTPRRETIWRNPCEIAS